MSKELSEFAPVAGLNGIFSATKGGLRCTAIRLRSGDLCLFSPVAGLSDAAVASLQSLGKVTALLAPNQYHNKGLVEYAGHFPDASLIAPAACHLRLRKITGLVFKDIETLEGALPDGIRFVAPEGLKTGEVWIITPDAWVVVDAFAGAKADGCAAQLLRTFPRYGVGDRARYTAWVRDALKRIPPRLLIPCHGGLVSAPDLPEQLLGLLDQVE